MPKFGNTSRTRLSTCHRDLVRIFNDVVARYDCSVLCGHRPKDLQDQAVAQHKSRTPWPGSKHNRMPSLAIDVAPWPIDWDDIGRFYHFAGFVHATTLDLFERGEIEHRIRWGGDWNRDGRMTTDPTQKFNDLVHFELFKPQ